MKFTKQDLLTLLIGLFLFASCKSTNSIGFEPDPAVAVKGDLGVLPVSSATVADEPTTTIGLPRHPLGYINGDPIFGNTEASLSLAVTLPANGYSFGKTPTIDSAVLVLPYSTQFYGDTTTSVYSLNVRQLKDDLALQKSFMSNREWPTETSVLGTFTGKIQPKTTSKIYDIVAGKEDTLKTVIPQLRIKLNNAFIQNNILNLDSATLSRNAKFSNFFKGLHISVNKANATGKGGMMFFNFGGSDAKVEIYYKKQNETTTTNIDTVAVNFPINTSVGPVAATIKHDYTGTPVKAQLDAPAGTYPVTYLQAMAGIRNKISFPKLKAFADSVIATGKATGTKIVINKAELVINLNSGTDVAPFTAAQRLSLYRMDIGGLRVNIPDNDVPSQTNPGEPYRYAGSELAFGGFYDATNKRYIFTVTAYMQDLIDGKAVDYGTFIAPTSLTEFTLAPSVSSSARSVINTITHATGEKSIKLNIYYTKVN